MTFTFPYFSHWEARKWFAENHEKHVALRHKPGCGEGADGTVCAFGEMLGPLPLFLSA